MASSTKTCAPLFSVSAKCTRGTVTPYKLSVAIFIQEYCFLKVKENSMPLVVDEGCSSPPAVMHSRHRRDFCMLSLKLIQSPDMDMSELYREITSGKYNVSFKTIRNFKDRMKKLFDEGISSLLDVSQSLKTLMNEPTQLNPSVHRSSIIGIYLRRIAVYFDKLNFTQLVSLFHMFKQYYEQAGGDHSQQDGGKSEFTKIGEPLGMKTSLTDTPASSLPVGRIRDSQVKRGKESDNERVCWSKRQADLFISQQAALIQNNEPAALPPRELQKKIHQLQRDNPDYPGVHFLRFLNCVRNKEFPGAVDSLHHCWDRNSFFPEGKSLNLEEKVRSLRYAALNLAMLHTLFGHNKEAIQALKEAIMTAHEGNDNHCLQHALAWLYKLSKEDNKMILMERSITKSTELNLSYLTSLGILALNQLEAADKGIPALIFDLSFTSDSLNCQHSMTDLMVTSYAQRAALWCLYGKTQMCSLLSQLVLHMNTFTIGQGVTSYNGEGCCLAACNIANILTEQGEYYLAGLVLRHAQERHPSDPLAVWWKLSEQLLHFTRAMHHGRWQEAEQAVAHMANVNKWESRLRKVELMIAKGDYVNAMSVVTAVLDYCKSQSQPDCSTVDVNVRALVLFGELQCYSAPNGAIKVLSTALSAAQSGHQTYHAAFAGLLMASVQLQMGLASHALKLIHCFLLTILSHGSMFDKARALLLLAKCKVAAAASLEPEQKRREILDAIDILGCVKTNFQKVEAYSRMKDVLYLQALLCNEVGNNSERNKYAAEFRQLDEQYPTKVPTVLLTHM